MGAGRHCMAAGQEEPRARFSSRPPCKRTFSSGLQQFSRSRGCCTQGMILLPQPCCWPLCLYCFRDPWGRLSDRFGHSLWLVPDMITYQVADKAVGQVAEIIIE